MSITAKTRDSSAASRNKVRALEVWRAIVVIPLQPNGLAVVSVLHSKALAFAACPSVGGPFAFDAKWRFVPWGAGEIIRAIFDGHQALTLKPSRMAREHPPKKEQD